MAGCRPWDAREPGTLPCNVGPSGASRASEPLTFGAPGLGRVAKQHRQVRSYAGQDQQHSIAAGTTTHASSPTREKKKTLPTCFSIVAASRATREEPSVSLAGRAEYPYSAYFDANLESTSKTALTRQLGAAVPAFASDTAWLHIICSRKESSPSDAFIRSHSRQTRA